MTRRRKYALAAAVALLVAAGLWVLAWNMAHDDAGCGDPAGLTTAQRDERSQEYERTFGQPAPVIPADWCESSPRPERPPHPRSIYTPPGWTP